MLGNEAASDWLFAVVALVDPGGAAAAGVVEVAGVRAELVGAAAGLGDAAPLVGVAWTTREMLM